MPMFGKDDVTLPEKGQEVKSVVSAPLVVAKPKWRLTDTESQKFIQSVMLLDGQWHGVKAGSFQVDEEDEIAFWREQLASDSSTNFRVACPLASVCAVRVLIV